MLPDPAPNNSKGLYQATLYDLVEESPSGNLRPWLREHLQGFGHKESRDQVLGAIIDNKPRLRSLQMAATTLQRNYPEETKNRRVRETQRLDALWGENPWMPPLAIAGPKFSGRLADRDISTLVRISNDATRNGLNLPSLYQPAGCIYEAAQSLGTPMRWSYKLLNTALGILTQQVNQETVSGAGVPTPSPHVEYSEMGQPSSLEDARAHDGAPGSPFSDRYLPAPSTPGASWPFDGSTPGSPSPFGLLPIDPCPDWPLTDLPADPLSPNIFPEPAAFPELTPIDTRILLSSAADAPLEPLPAVRSPHPQPQPLPADCPGLPKSPVPVGRSQPPPTPVHCPSQSLPADRSAQPPPADCPALPESPLLAGLSLHPPTATDATLVSKQLDNADQAVAQLRSNGRLTDDTIYLISRLLTLSLKACNICDPLFFSEAFGADPVILPRGVSSSTRLLVPLYHSVKHWSLAVCDLGKGRIQHYDSIPSPRRSTDTRRRLSRWAAAVSPGVEVQVTSMAGPQQTDATSCGVHVVQAIEHLLRGYPDLTGMQAEDVVATRRRLAETIETAARSMSRPLKHICRSPGSSSEGGGDRAWPPGAGLTKALEHVDGLLALAREFVQQHIPSYHALHQDAAEIQQSIKEAEQKIAILDEEIHILQDHKLPSAREKYVAALGVAVESRKTSRELQAAIDGMRSGVAAVSTRISKQLETIYAGMEAQIGSCRHSLAGAEEQERSSREAFQKLDQELQTAKVTWARFVEHRDQEKVRLQEVQHAMGITVQLGIQGQD
ncbi:hypothetical protein CSOJ01_15418 [Colletotrichum sojae]|uniref:Ubiquitin-like protease family profile domain-containing protein n=1 Tax=Colletotrichum sojae TaxID=2175907 RepID=A0A8H6MIS2_9PEZI|nr:hypothetical protein CSOJ01_15418 [Colletotrichum sojae]